jgi:hypothetical protein
MNSSVRKVVGVDVMRNYVIQASYSLEQASGISNTKKSVALRTGDFTGEEEVDLWKDCNVVFACSTMYDERLMGDIGRLFAEKCELGAWLITLDKSVEREGVERVGEMEGEGSWGRTRVCLHRRVAQGGSAEPEKEVLW